MQDPEERLDSSARWDSIRRLSPCRNSTISTTIPELVDEQLRHFGIDPESEFGHNLASITKRLYQCGPDLDTMWQLTQESLHTLDYHDRISRFNAKKFLSFQLAKLLDKLQNSFRSSYQQLDYHRSTLSAKGAYPIFDNVTALFSATPVIARTATYIYACAEWIEEAFKGKEFLHEIYSRLLNPTSLSLANHIVDLEAGPYASDYLAWNYSSGMAAIDSVLSHILGYQDLLLVNRNIYGGSHQLIHNWYAKASNFDIKVEQFNGESRDDFQNFLSRIQKKYSSYFNKDRLKNKRPYLFLESPCNPCGYVLDVPGICKLAHRHGVRVVLDSTVATPFLSHPLQRKDPEERPDFVIHSYSKDISGSGSVIAGTVIGRNEDMFVPKGDRNWEETMFWNVYYVKGAFLNADAAYEVLQGMCTLEIRMLNKCINTRILARFFDQHPLINVQANCLDHHPNAILREKLLFLGLPAPLFTIDIKEITQKIFQRFLDCLAPTFNHMISLGQTNTIISCPGLTTHSELDKAQLKEAGITQTTIRFSIGNENPRDLIRHFLHSARLMIDPDIPGFSNAFMKEKDVDKLIKTSYLDTHQAYIDSRLTGSRKS